MNGSITAIRQRISLTDRDIAELTDAVRPSYTEKRFAHALSVEEEAVRLGRIFLPERIHALRAAALLHDATKKYDYEKQLQCCAEFGIILNNPVSPEVLHAVTGAAVAGRDFSVYTDDDILSGIRWHTTGRWGMTVFDSIIFLSDYIEPLRTHEKCVTARNCLYRELEAAKTEPERNKALNRAVVRALNNTISYLVHKGSVIDTDTISARNYYLTEKEL